MRCKLVLVEKRLNEICWNIHSLDDFYVGTVKWFPINRRIKFGALLAKQLNKEYIKTLVNDWLIEDEILGE